MTTLWLWLTPALLALFLWGVGQGLVKKYIADVPPARFCLFFFVAKSIVNVGYFLTHEHPPPTQHLHFMWIGIGAYCLDGLGWILYFKSILKGPITIVGTLSAAYPALVVVFARIFLAEVLVPLQYAGVVIVILACIGLSYSRSDEQGKTIDSRWIPLAATALILWALCQTIVKYSWSLPGADEANMLLFNAVGGALTVGAYGFFYGRKAKTPSSQGQRLREWSEALVPMSMMAGGDLAVIIASQFGPISIVSPLTGAYPVVTLGFAAFVLREKIKLYQYICVAAVLVGMYLCTG